MATAPRFEPDHPDAVRLELGARVDQLDRDFRLLSIGELCRRADAIRQIARANGFEPVARMATGLSDALGRGGRGTGVRPWIDGLRAALASDVQDEASARAFLAAVSVRLAG